MVSEMDKTAYREIGPLLRNAQRILVLSHIRPDGDAVGSLLGLGLALKAADKDVTMVLPEGLPEFFSHLEGSELIGARPAGEYDLIIVVDCSDLDRVGEALPDHQNPDINIDHHPTNPGFGRYNLVDSQAVATAEIITELLQVCDLPVTRPVADALLFGMITDTLGFRTANMTAKALRLAADLVEAGGNLPELYRRGLLSRSFEAARFWGAGLSNLQRDGRLIWTTLRLQDRQMAGYPGRDDADLTNVLSTIEGADVAIVFTEQADGHVKVSWRSEPGFDVSQVALKFGGGGHAAAAGADIEGSLNDVQQRVIQVTKNTLGLDGRA